MSTSTPVHSSHPPKHSSHPSRRPVRARRQRLGELLVLAGKVTQSDMDDAIQEQHRHRGKRLGEILVARGLVTERDLAATLAQEFDLPFVDLATYPINPAALGALPAAIILKHHVLPIDIQDGALTVALGDPLDALDAVRLN